MHGKSRDLMAPDTEPTDEELALVMREARELAVQRRAAADLGRGATEGSVEFRSRKYSTTADR